jgi:hypothetical protein
LGSYEGIAAVLADLGRVRSVIGSPGTARLDELLTEFATCADAERDGVAGQLTRFVLEHLPHDDPVYAQFDRVRLGTATPARLPALFAARKLLGLPVANSPRERILRAPATSAFLLRARGADPELPGLIRLHRDDGGMDLPDFQFDEHDRPWDVVMSVNRLLDADHDPWGVADWWLSGNAWLGDPPAALLGSVDDDDLLAAATAAVEG